MRHEGGYLNTGLVGVLTAIAAVGLFANTAKADSPITATPSPALQAQPTQPETLPSPAATVNTENTETRTSQDAPASVEAVGVSNNNQVNPVTQENQKTQETQETQETKQVGQNTPVAPAEVKILAPAPATVLDIPATTVILQFPVGALVELRVNGNLVDPNSIGRSETDAQTNLVTQTWYGVSFKQGENTITASATNNGTALPVGEIKVMVRASAKTLTVETVEKRIPADGRSTATVRGQLVDENGNRSNEEAIVTLEASAGEFIGTDAAPNQPGFQVQARRGNFSANLRSSLNAQQVRIRATTGTLEAFNQIEFQTALRPSIVTGVVDVRLGSRGTDYYSSFRDFLPPDKNNPTQLNFYSGVFATGAIGDWLFTGAYNSARTINQDCSGNSGLSRDVQQCQQYSVYGDSSRSERLARSQDSVYLRFERDRDYAMWGDYDTQEFARASQEFTATNRQLHGFKANYNFGNLQVTGFYGNNVQGFQRDTIAPDGTSGYYFLSRRLLVSGSENVFIELEELARPGTVLERKQLTRGTDYEIDYDRGTLLFREPVLRTDVSSQGLVLVRRIVATYQFEQRDSTANIYASRVQYNFSREQNRESWLAASYLRENQGIRSFELYGADALISLGPKANLIAEYARSNNNSEMMGFVGGSAYRVEAQAEIADSIQARAYYRSTDTGFANNATTSFVPGQTRYGANVTARVSPSTNVRVQYDREDNRGIAPRPLNTLEELLRPGLEAVPGSKVDNSLTTVSAGVEQRIGNVSVGVDFIHRQRTDRLPNNPLNQSSNQLRSRLTAPLTNNLTFVAQNETNLSAQQDIAYPNRTLFGLDWTVYPGVNVRLSHQFFSGGQFANNSITSLDITGEHKLGSDTAITARSSIVGGANEMNVQGAIGLKQGWSITPGLRLNLAYEHVFGNVFARTGAGVQFAQPFTPGQSASSLGVEGGDSYSVGLEWTDNPNFKASASYEHRSSSQGSNTLISASAIGKITPALTALVRYQQSNSGNQTLRGLLGDTVDLKVGLAFRDPNNDTLNALLRYEHRKNPSSIPETLLLGSGTGYEDNLFAAEVIYAPNWQWEFYGKFGIRNSTSYLASDLIGSSTVTLAQVRATYRLGYNMDLVGEARFINQANTGYSEKGLVIEAGYYLTPNLRLSAGYVFGSADDRDFSGTRSAGGPYLGLTVKLNELFSGFGLQKVAPPQQQESQVKPVATNSPTPTATPESTPPADAVPATTPTGGTQP